MFEFLLQDSNLPFSISLSIMLIFTFLEIVSLLIGLGFSNMFDAILPDIEFDAVNSSSHSFLAWLNIGKVPFLILLILFLSVFGIVGLAIQMVVMMLINSALPVLIAVAISMSVSLFAVHTIGRSVQPLFSDQSSAVSKESFVGRIATITLGTAKSGQPAEAKVVDSNGYTHYVLIEPFDDDSDSYVKGDEVVVVKNNGASYLGTRFTL